MANQTRVGWRPYVSSLSSLLLDTYTGATVAYSLRKLKSTYSGSSIRVRRSIDNSEKDISFDSSGNLDTNALLDFVGYPNQFIFGSETLSTNTAFTATALTVTGNWLTGPDGVTPGNKLTETTAFNYHNTGYSILSGNNATVGTANFSGYLKKGTGSAAPDRIAVGVGNGTYYMYAIFNLSTGTIETQNYSGTVTNYSAQMTSAGNGWYRCSVGGVLNFPGTQSIRISFQFVNNSAAYNPFTSTGYVGNVNADVQVTQVQYIKEAGLQRYGKTLNSGGGTQGGGFVTNWYDQSGNSKHSTQPTANSQPQIVSNGALSVQNGKPSLYFNETTSWLQCSPFANPTYQVEPISLISVMGLNTGYSTIGNYCPYGTYSTTQFRLRITNNKYGIYNGTTELLSTVNASAGQKIISNIFSTTDKLRVNGVEVISGNSGNNVGTYFGIGKSQWSGWNYNGYIQEFIVYTSDQLSNVNALESNINSYYSTY